jgi:hypothetical protein
MRPTPGCPHPPSTPTPCTPARCTTVHCTAENNPPNHYLPTIPLQRTQPPAHVIPALPNLPQPAPNPHRPTLHPTEDHPTPRHRAQHLRTRIRDAIRTARTRLITLSRFRWVSS